MMTIRLILLTMFASVCVIGFANAAELNKDITLQNDVLTVGDVFTDAGVQADHVLGPAPKPGDVMVLDVKTLKRIAGSFAVDWTPVRGTETASIRSGAAKPVKIMDTAPVKIPVLAEAVGRDDVIAASNIIWVEVPASTLKDDTALKDSDLIGLSARVLLQPNEAISKNLLVAPKMIKRGDMVTLSLVAGPIALTAKGKALDNARLGELVRVQNQDSEKIVQGRVTGPATATIEPQS